MPCSFGHEVDSHSARGARRERAHPTRGRVGLWAGFLRLLCPRLRRQKGQCHRSPRLPDSARRPVFPSAPRGCRVAILKRKRKVGRKNTEKQRLSEKSDAFSYGSSLSTSAKGPGDPGPTPPPAPCLPLTLRLCLFCLAFSSRLYRLRSSKSCPPAKLTPSPRLFHYLSLLSLLPPGLTVQMKLSKVIKHLHHSLPLFSWGTRGRGRWGVQNENFEGRHSEAAGKGGPEERGRVGCRLGA